MNKDERLTREEFKKKQELDLARKAGTAPAELDEDGNEINPHIPQYISQAPWYLNTTHPTLKHQRNLLERVDYAKAGEWYGQKVTKRAATKFRKGACKNCGAMTHKVKDCVERPRKKGAHLTGRDIRPDEVVQDITLDYDGKRDRWNGYDPSEYKRVIDKFEKTDAARRKVKAKALEDKFVNTEGAVSKKPKPSKLRLAPGQEGESDSEADSDSDMGSSDDDDDDLKEKEKKAMLGYVDTKRRVSVRNLRIREDTAKYLLNLDVNSAYYDPKSRSMREDPNPDKKGDGHFHGDNYSRFTGDANDFAGQQLFAWEAQERGSNVHLLAAPSQSELMFKNFKDKKKNLREEQKKRVLKQYGGEEHLENPHPELLVAQTENYVEYARDGRVVKGKERATARSKYEEDVLVGNHTEVWGSFWKKGQWGFACCQQTSKNSYCTGQAGIANSSGGSRLALDPPPVNPNKETEAVFKKPEAPQKKRKRDDDDDLDFETQVKKALKKQAKDEAKAELLLEMDERDRPYNHAKGTWEVTDAEMEAYHLRKQREDDPMANFKDE